MSHLRQILSLVAVVLVLVVVPGAGASAQQRADNLTEPPSKAHFPTKSIPVANGQYRIISHEGAVLEVGPDAVVSKATISVTPLTDEDLPALDQGMTNVTQGTRRGYRFLPHNTKFKRHITISLPYDKALLPPGLTEQDIYTFYFDDQSGSWQRLERVEVDTRQGVVVSLSDHFTDMINGAVTVPEHPMAQTSTPIA
jgi:hypothetical protein